MTLKWLLKRTAFAVGAVLVSPWVLLTKIQLAWTGGETMFASTTAGLSLVPGSLGQYMRLAFYRLTLQSCSLDVCFGFGSQVSHPTAEIGEDVTVGGGANIGTATIGDHVLISPRVSILSGRHQHDVWSTEQNVTDAIPSFERVFIGSNSWIGEGAIIMANVGERCVVAAGAVVFRPVADNKLAMGNPARAMAGEFSSGARSLERRS